MNKATWVQAIATCVLVVATIVLVIVNIGLVKTTKRYADISEKTADYTQQYVEQSKKYVTTTREMVNEMKKDREERKKPYISVRICKAGQNYYLGLFNLGGSPAYNIKISCMPAVFKSFSMKRLSHKDEFFVHLAHESILISPQKPEPFQIAIEYKDRLGKSYSDTVHSELKDARFDTDMNIFLAIKEIGRWLEYISKNLEKNGK